MTVATSHSIMLEWDRPSPEEENGLLVRYHVILTETQIHYNDDGVEITGVLRYLNRTYNVSEGRMQLVETLHPDYNYTVRIAAATEPGIGPFSDPITVRTSMDGEYFSILIVPQLCICTMFHIKITGLPLTYCKYLYVAHLVCIYTPARSPGI